MANIYGKYNLLRKYITRDGINYEPIDEYVAVPTSVIYSKDCGLNYDIVFKRLSTSNNYIIKLNNTDYYLTTKDAICVGNLSDLGITELTSCASAFTRTQISDFIFFPDTSKVTDMSYMFYNKSGLTSIDVSNLNTSNVTTMNSMFSGCTKLTSLDVSSFDTSNVTDMSRMFDVCSGLTSLNVSGWDLSNVTNMGELFNSCRGLITSDDIIGLETWNTINVTDMNNMFADCRNLVSLDLSSFDTSNVTDMTGMFYLCYALNSLDISNFNTSAVTKMYGMFKGCSGLTSLDLSSFDTSNVTNMSQMFYSCSNLTSLDLSNIDASKVTNTEYMFKDCYNLTSLKYFKKSPTMAVQIPNTVTDIDLSKWDSSNVTSMSSMFYDCSGLTSLDLSNLNTSNVTTMSNMFYHCSGLTSLDLSNFDTSKVTNVKYMFGYCSALTSLDLSGWDLTNVTTYTNYSSMFSNCKSLQYIYVCGCNQATIDKINDVKPANAEIVFNAYVFNNEYVCGSEINGDFAITSVSGNWTKEGGTFTSNTITDSQTTTQRIYFTVSQPTTIVLDIDQSSESSYDYLLISKIDTTVVDSITSSNNFTNWCGRTTGSVTIPVTTSGEHFIELMYKKDGSQSSGRDNVIVTFKNNFDATYQYEIWREVDCQDHSIYTGNVEYRNPQASCDCGWTGLTWVFNNEYINGSELQNARYISFTDIDTATPFRTVRIDATDPGTSGYYFIRLSTSPNSTGSNQSYSICPDEGTIYDGGSSKRITAQTHIEGKIYEYTFSRDMYLATNQETYSPLRQVSAYIDGYDENSKYEIWRETQLCNVDNFTGNVEYRNPQPL